MNEYFAVIISYISLFYWIGAFVFIGLIVGTVTNIERDKEYIIESLKDDPQIYKKKFYKLLVDFKYPSLLKTAFLVFLWPLVAFYLVYKALYSYLLGVYDKK